MYLLRYILQAGQCVVTIRDVSEPTTAEAIEAAAKAAADGNAPDTTLVRVMREGAIFGKFALTNQRRCIREIAI